MRLPDVPGELEPRPCRTCGAETGSVALDECADCERARAAIEQFHLLATCAHARAVADLHVDREDWGG